MDLGTQVTMSAGQLGAIGAGIALGGTVVGLELSKTKQGQKALSVIDNSAAKVANLATFNGFAGAKMAKEKNDLEMKILRSQAAGL